MTTTKKKTPVRPNAPEPMDEDDIFEKTIVDAMTQAAKDAIAENDRLGIPSPGGKDGKIVYRTPPRKHVNDTSDSE